MNTGFECRCGSRQVHAILRKYGNKLMVEYFCRACRTKETIDISSFGSEMLKP